MPEFTTMLRWIGAALAGFLAYVVAFMVVSALYTRFMGNDAANRAVIAIALATTAGGYAAFFVAPPPHRALAPYAFAGLVGIYVALLTFFAWLHAAPLGGDAIALMGVATGAIFLWTGARLQQQYRPT